MRGKPYLVHSYPGSIVRRTCNLSCERWRCAHNLGFVLSEQAALKAWRMTNLDHQARTLIIHVVKRYGSNVPGFTPRCRFPMYSQDHALILSQRFTHLPLQAIRTVRLRCDPSLQQGKGPPHPRLQPVAIQSPLCVTCTRDLPLKPARSPLTLPTAHKTAYVQLFDCNCGLSRIREGGRQRNLSVGGT